MSYRRQSEKDERWKKFRIAHSNLAGDAGLPDEFLASEATFVEFLMHGFIRQKSPDPVLPVDGMSPDQYQRFLALVHQYFEAGFPYFTPVALRLHSEMDELKRLFGGKENNNNH